MSVLHSLVELPVAPGWSGSPRALADDLRDPSRTLLQQVLDPAAIREARDHVVENGGCAGADGRSVSEVDEQFDSLWKPVHRAVLEGSYRPSPLLGIEIPKPGTDKTRPLSIPTVMDRILLQSIAGVLAPFWEPEFSENSFAYRPGRSAHQAVASAQRSLNRGNRWVVDLDIERYFDNVPQKRLLDRMRRDFAALDAEPLIDLIERFLRAPRQIDGGLVPPKGRGLPQGSPLSPLLANFYLDALDRFLDSHGCEFARYADDFVVLCLDEARGREIYEATEAFLREALDLRLNREKSQVVPPEAIKFLGFTFDEERGGKRFHRRIHPDSIVKFKCRVAVLVCAVAATPTATGSPDFSELRDYVRGWRGFYRFTQHVGELDATGRHLHREIRAALWTRWGSPIHPRGRAEELTRRGLREEEANEFIQKRGSNVTGEESILVRAMPAEKIERLLRPRRSNSGKTALRGTPPTRKTRPDEKTAPPPGKASPNTETSSESLPATIPARPLEEDRWLTCRLKIGRWFDGTLSLGPKR